MASITVRLQDHEREALVRQAQAEGKSLSALVRDRVLGEPQVPSERAEALERRLARLEEMAGL